MEAEPACNNPCNPDNKPALQLQAQQTLQEAPKLWLLALGRTNRDDSHDKEQHQQY